MRKELIEAMQRIAEGNTVRGFKTNEELAQTSSPELDVADFETGNSNCCNRAVGIAKSCFNDDSKLERLDNARNR